MKKHIIYMYIAVCALTLMGIQTSSAKGAKGSNSEQNVSQAWLDYVEAQKSGKPSLFPDYSYAGYKFGEEGVPDLKAKVFNICDYGAVADDGKSDREALEAAIAAATENGGGVVLIPKGRFHVRPESAPNKPIEISCSNFVLRGEKGAELFMEYPNPTVDPKKLYASPSLFSIKGKGTGAKISDVTKDVQRGSFSVEVASAEGLDVGEWVCLEVRNNDPAFLAQEMAPYVVEPKWKQIIEDGVYLYEYHLITAIDGNKLTFKAPLMRDVERRWGWVIREYTPLEEVGIEGISFVGDSVEDFVHHRSWNDDGGYSMLSMGGLVNSWLRDCTFTNVSNAATVGQSANVSVYNCVIKGRIGHAAIKSQGSTRVFLGNIDDQPAQWHSTGVSKPAIGTVIWRTRTAPNSCFESHASQPRLSLFDAAEGGFMKGHAGGAVGSNPNHLGGLLMWNYKQTNDGEENFVFWAVPLGNWRIVMPLFVGFHAAEGVKMTTFRQEQVLLDESHGEAVYPESLYEAQLELRLGELPSWLKRIKKNLYINN